ncbi:MAG TPA: LuxR C-terminal-related transcriptional regulator [Chitinophagaceae bacterium]|nr:LuxR C-terminal-related transcriptional regulator [Chitinophagaceae bacterium]
MKPTESSFTKQFSTWRNKVTRHEKINWSEQLRILNNIADLITPQLSLEEITNAIYENVNHLIDAYQFCVGLYDEKEGMILYKGIIEDGKKIPDFMVNAIDGNRLAAWCIRNEEDIFMNDFDKEVTKYLDLKPIPITGASPKAAIYTPLKLNNKVVGLIVVRAIHKNVYEPHHLYILKTVGNFVIRALELAKISSKAYVKTEGLQKEWRWCNAEQLPAKSKKALTQLTEREKEVLFLLVTGLPNKAIAEILFVSPGTIKTHTLNIYQKMDVANRTSAILKAIEYGWFL